MLIRISTTIASVITIGFGVWHFFVPKIWNWYGYIDSKATELLIAVQAVNVFFSLSLVVFGLVNILLVWNDKVDRYAVLVILSASVILWVTRAAMQIAYPQGSVTPFLQYGMLAAFLAVTALYALALVLTWLQKAS